MTGYIQVNPSLPEVQQRWLFLSLFALTAMTNPSSRFASCCPACALMNIWWRECVSRLVFLGVERHFMTGAFVPCVFRRLYINVRPPVLTLLMWPLLSMKRRRFDLGKQQSLSERRSLWFITTNNVCKCYQLISGFNKTWDEILKLQISNMSWPLVFYVLHSGTFTTHVRCNESPTSHYTTLMQSSS